MLPQAGGLSLASHSPMPRLIEAAVRGDKAVIVELLKDDALAVNEVDSETMTALHWAAAYNEPSIIQLLLADKRVEANVRNKRQGTPLHQASLSGASESLAALLADPRVEVNALNQWQETPLMLAAAAGNRTSVLSLLRARADVTLVDQWGSTACAAHGEVAIAQTLKLVTDGTATDIRLASLLVTPTSSSKSSSSCSAPSSASSVSTTTTPSKVRRILSKMMEAPLNEETAIGWLSDPDLDINSPDFYKWTPVHKCCAWDKPAFLQALLKHPNLAVHLCTETSPAGMDEDTPLHQAAETGSVRCVTLLLTDARTQLEARNAHGQTPLMLAARTNRIEVVKLLLSRGAKADAAQKDRRTGWHLAKECEFEDIARLLWDVMSDSAKGMVEEITLLHATKIKATPKKAAAVRGKLNTADLQNRKIIESATARPALPKGTLHLLPLLPKKAAADAND